MYLEFKKRPKFHRYDTIVGFEMLSVKFSSAFFYLFTELFHCKRFDVFENILINWLIAKFVRVRLVDGGPFYQRKTSISYDCFGINIRFYQEYINWFFLIEKWTSHAEKEYG